MSREKQESTKISISVKSSEKLGKTMTNGVTKSAYIVKKFVMKFQN
jgi:hypothetical protein